MKTKYLLIPTFIIAIMTTVSCGSSTSDILSADSDASVDTNGGTSNNSDASGSSADTTEQESANRSLMYLNDDLSVYTGSYARTDYDDSYIDSSVYNLQRNYETCTGTEYESGIIDFFITLDAEESISSSSYMIDDGDLEANDEISFAVDETAILFDRSGSCGYALVSTDVITESESRIIYRICLSDEDEICDDFYVQYEWPSAEEINQIAEQVAAEQAANQSNNTVTDSTIHTPGGSGVTYGGSVIYTSGYHGSFFDGNSIISW